MVSLKSDSIFQALLETYLAECMEHGELLLGTGDDTRRVLDGGLFDGHNLAGLELCRHLALLFLQHKTRLSSSTSTSTLTCCNATTWSSILLAASYKADHFMSSHNQDQN